MVASSWSPPPVPTPNYRFDFSSIGDIADIYLQKRKQDLTQQALKNLMGAQTPEEKQSSLFGLMQVNPAMATAAATIMTRGQLTPAEQAKTDIEEFRGWVSSLDTTEKGLISQNPQMAPPKYWKFLGVQGGDQPMNLAPPVADTGKPVAQDQNYSALYPPVAGKHGFPGAVAPIQTDPAGALYPTQTSPSAPQETKTAQADISEGPPPLQAPRSREEYVQQQSELKAQAEVDKKYAADFLQWNQGGFSEANANLENLKHAKALLEKDDSLSGPVIGAQVKKSLAGNEDVMTMAARMINSEAFNVAQAHQRAVVASLRPLVGARAAQQLFQSVLQSTYDPMARTKENSRRLGLVINNIERATKAKQAMSEYFVKYKTLRGYRGPQFNAASFNPAEGVDEQKSLGKSNEPEGTIRKNKSGDTIKTIDGEWIAQ